MFNGFKKVWLPYLLLLFSVQVYSQSKTIRGKVTVPDENKDALPILTIVDENNRVLKFVVAKENGSYELMLPVSADRLWVEVNCFGFKKQRKELIPETEIYDFLLEPEPISLQEVKIKADPVVQTGDTLMYNVARFAQQEDRSIGDVLRRMPGIEVDSDGVIYHNGKKVENLYIHGDDLMEGRYGVATKAIKKELITHINVIRNYQPLKVLQNKIQTDKVAIDLVLKDENSLKVSGNLTAGAGLPNLYELNGSQLILNKNIKMINTAGINNAGYSYEQEVNQIGTPNFLSGMSHEAAEIPLSLGTNEAPGLPQRYYFLNRSAYISLNNLYTFNNGFQLRLNTTGLKDHNSLRYFSSITSFLENDTLVYNETQRLINNPEALNISLNLMANKTTFFFNNNIKMGWVSRSDNSSLMFNERAFDQTLNKKLVRFSNDLSVIPALKNKHIAEVRWFTSYNNIRQKLSIENDYEVPFYVSDFQYDYVRQKIDMPAFFSDASLSYKIPKNNRSQDYKIGYITEVQDLLTDLGYERNAQFYSFMLDHGNQIDWVKKNPYFSALYQFRVSSLKSEIHLPLEYQTIQYSQSEYNLEVDSRRVIFKPRVNLNMEFTPEKRLAAAYSFNNYIGNLTNVYPGAVLLNYRTLWANDPTLQIRNQHNASLKYEFQKSIHMLFAFAGISYSLSSANTILSVDFYEDLQRSHVLLMKNNQENLRLNGGINKFFWAPKFKISLDGSWSQKWFEQIINDSQLPFYGNNFNLKIALNKQISERLGLNYEARNWLSQSKKRKTSSPVQVNQFARMEHLARIEFKPLPFFYGDLSAVYSRSKQANYSPIEFFFLDLNARYKLKSPGLELSATLINLLNVKTFKIYNVNINQLTYDEFGLRGRTVLLKASYFF